MRLLLGLSTIIDGINEKIGVVCNWLVLLACVVSGSSLNGVPVARTPLSSSACHTTGERKVGRAAAAGCALRSLRLVEPAMLLR